MPAKEAPVGLARGISRRLGALALRRIHIGPRPELERPHGEIQPVLQGERLRKHQGVGRKVAPASLPPVPRGPRQGERGRPEHGKPAAHVTRHFVVPARNGAVPRQQVRPVGHLARIVHRHVPQEVVPVDARERGKKGKRHVARQCHLVVALRRLGGIRRGRPRDSAGENCKNADF